MTKRKSLIWFLITIVAMIILPITVYAESNKEPITVYLFRGSTCPHCENALKFFERLVTNKEFKDKIVVRHLEIWEDKTNYELANQAAEALGEKAINGSVPFIVIGEKTWKGYSSSSDEEIKTAIKEAYNDTKYEDKIKDIVGDRGEILEVKNDSFTVILVGVIIVIVIGAIVFFARSSIEEDEKNENVSTKEAKKEEPKIIEKEEAKEIKKEEKIEAETKKEPTKKKTTSKKSNTTKNKKPNVKNKSKKSN